MKKLTILILIINNIYASNDLNTSSLDMFLFKIGFKSLTNDVQENKKITQNNLNRIKNLENKIQTMLDLNSKKQISNNLNLKSNLSNVKNNEILLLKQTIKSLKEKLNLINNKKTKHKILDFTNTSTNYKNARVAVKEAYILSKPNNNENIEFIAKRDDILKIEFCNNAGWCKLYKENQYIAKYKIKFSL